MPLRLMLCAFILLALGGCQNPSLIFRQPRPFRGGGMMALILRPTGLGAGIDKDRRDYTVYIGDWAMGRIYEVRGGPDHLRWFWSFTVDPPMTRSDPGGDAGGGQGAIPANRDAWRRGRDR